MPAEWTVTSIKPSPTLAAQANRHMFSLDGIADRSAAQPLDDHARSRDLAGSRSAIRHARPDPGIRKGAATARLERRAAIATARKYGCAVLSRNVRDFDLLQQLDPSGKVMFYRIGPQ